MQKILPICEAPQFSELHTTAFPLSVLNTEDGFSENWLLMKFLQIIYTKKFGHVLTYDLPFFWFWECFEFHLRLHGPGSNVIHSIQHWLDKEYYVFLCVNEKYIPQRFDYQLKNFDHELLIYGYRDSPMEFYTIGYNDKLHYTTQIICEQDLKKAFYYCKYHYFKFYPFRRRQGYLFSIFG